MPISSAIESIFANAQQNAASLIETATLAINAKVNTIEEAEVMIQELSSEAVKYNELLTTIMNAMRQVESGDMNKEEAACIIIPAVKELKDKCTALKIANVEAPGDDITEDEIAILRELIIGAKAAAEDRLVAIRLGDDEREDPELVLQWENTVPNKSYQELLDEITSERKHKSAKKAAKKTKHYESEDNNMDIFGSAYESMIDQCMLEEMDYEAATEGANWDARKLNKSYSKEIRGLAKQAKKEYKLGNYTIAKNLYNKCSALCDEAIADIKSIDNNNSSLFIGSLLHMVRTIGSTLAFGPIAMGYKAAYAKIDREIDKLNSAGMGELTKAQYNKYITDIIMDLKTMSKKYKKLADKAAKGELNSNSANEGFVDEFNYDEFMFACEAYMDDMMAAMESDEDGTDDEAPSKKAGKIRSLFSKISRAFKRGNKEEVEALKKEADAAVKDLADAEANAPEEQKSKYRKAAKTAAIAVGATAAVVGLTMAGTAIVQKAKGSEIDPTALFKIAGSVTHGAVQNIGDAAASRRVGRAEMKNENVSVNDAMRANRYLEHQALKHEQKVAKADRKETKKYNKMKMAQKEKEKEDAKKIAKASTDAFGISEFDLYEVILEAMCSEDCFEYDSDVELADAIEAML